MITFIIRIVLSFLLIYGVFTETGVFTALFCFLTMLSIEVTNYNQKSLISSMRDVIDIKSLVSNRARHG